MKRKSYRKKKKILKTKNKSFSIKKKLFLKVKEIK